MGKMSLDNKLGLDRFNIDQHNPHITINDGYDNKEKINLLVMACPAGLYQYENGKLSFNHEGCLECGTCRVLSKGRVVKSWSYPVGGKGIEFTQG
ncbi:ferredoxin like protein [Sporobacter termitidis DSM 10068]|uniref:Ferredoxin like protein n=1 Tax=Sporobacter termitidis DSM 10068 TaxID=1123282 RepID=A0A1M5XVQ4_9FIRM|nr:4Fe-4S dicluster domain-containing protein [Sporobacter termitidis]SHI03870.1 ferredoxin like protein [Sporobacter termitidis DSM 10068]